MKAKSSISLIMIVVMTAGCMNVFKFDGKQNAVKSVVGDEDRYISAKADAHLFTKRWPMETKGGAERRSFGYITHPVTANLPPDMIEIHENIPTEEYFRSYEAKSPEKAKEEANGKREDGNSSERIDLKGGSSGWIGGKILQNIFRLYVRVLPGSKVQHTEADLKKFGDVKAHESLAFQNENVVSFPLQMKEYETVTSGRSFEAIQKFNQRMDFFLKPVVAVFRPLVDKLPDIKIPEKWVNIFRDVEEIRKRLANVIQMHTRASELNTGLLNDDGYTDILHTKLVDIHINLEDLKALADLQSEVKSPEIQAALAFAEKYIQKFVPQFALELATSQFADKMVGSFVAPVGVVAMAAFYDPAQKKFRISELMPEMQLAMTETIQDTLQFSLEDFLGGLAEEGNARELERIEAEKAAGDLSDEEYAAEKAKFIDYVYNVELGDVDGDLKDDLTLIKKEAGKIEVYTWKNNSKGTDLDFHGAAEVWSDDNFMAAEGKLQGQKLRAAEVRLADMNGDGLDDIVAANEHSFPFSELNATQWWHKVIKGIIGPLADKLPFWSTVTIRVAIRAKPSVVAGADPNAFVHLEGKDQIIDERETSFWNFSLPGIGYSKVDSTVFVDVQGHGCESYTRIGNYAPDSPWALPNPFRGFMKRMMSYNTTDCAKIRELAAKALSSAGVVVGETRVTPKKFDTAPVEKSQPDLTPTEEEPTSPATTRTTEQGEE